MHATSKTTTYWLAEGDEPEREVSLDEFCAAERRCGFTSTPGCGPAATAGFSCTEPKLRGRVGRTARPKPRIGEERVVRGTFVSVVLLPPIDRALRPARAPLVRCDLLDAQGDFHYVFIPVLADRPQLTLKVAAQLLSNVGVQEPPRGWGELLGANPHSGAIDPQMLAARVSLCLRGRAGIVHQTWRRSSHGVMWGAATSFSEADAEKWQAAYVPPTPPVRPSVAQLEAAASAMYDALEALEAWQSPPDGCSPPIPVELAAAIDNALKLAREGA